MFCNQCCHLGDERLIHYGCDSISETVGCDDVYFDGDRSVYWGSVIDGKVGVGWVDACE